jgi:hypothetical protein
MARAISSELHIARNVLRQETGWLMFLEVALHSGQEIRLVHNARHMQADGRTWQAAEIGLEIPGEDAEGSLGELTFSVSNVSREPLRLVEVEDELLGCEVVAWLQHAANLDGFEPALSWRHTILEAEIGELVASFKAGHAAELQKVPGPLYTRQRFPQLLPGVGVRL